MANNTNKPIKITKNLSGPERWAIVDSVVQPEKTKSQASKFKKHDYSSWTNNQKQAYITAVTNINPNRGNSKDKKAGRNLGRYIKGNI